MIGFADLRGHYLNNGRYAANAGLGARYITDRANIVGGGIFYDYRQVRSNPFHEVGASFEFLGCRWEGRLNGYLSVGAKRHRTSKHKHISCEFGGFSGNLLLVKETIRRTKKYHYSLGGGDAEIGAYLLKPTDNFALFLGAGPYAYVGPVRRAAVGGQARLQGRITPYLTLQIIESWDTVFHNHVQGEISLNFHSAENASKKIPNTMPPVPTFPPPLHASDFRCIDVRSFLSTIIGNILTKKRFALRSILRQVCRGILCLSTIANRAAREPLSAPFPPLMMRKRNQGPTMSSMYA